MPSLASIHSDSNGLITQSTADISSVPLHESISQVGESENITYQILRDKLARLQQEKEGIVADYDEKIEALSKAVAVCVDELAVIADISQVLLGNKRPDRSLLRKARLNMI